MNVWKQSFWIGVLLLVGLDGEVRGESAGTDSLSADTAAGSSEKIRQPDAMDFRNPSLPTELRVTDLMNRLTQEEKIGLLCAKQPGIERLGIPFYDWWSECLHGVARAGQATVFPKPIATGSSWDPDLAKRIATAISDEARAKYNMALRTKGYTARYEGLTFFSPTLNLARDPRWGRTDECYSEDPLLTGSMGSAFIAGLQGDDPRYLKLVATSKHFVANNEENRRLDGSAEVDMRSLREYYFPAFRQSIEQGRVTSVMGAYNALNGVPCCANEFLLTQVLRQEWGFRGVVISDGSAMAKLYTHHHYAPSPEEAAALALKAGCDMSLRDEYGSTLPQALKRGLISEADIDTALRRVLTLRMRLGMFDPPEQVPFNAIPDSVVECRAHRDLALEAARKSIILLENQGILPLKPERMQKIALIGEAFRKVHYGDYSAEPQHNLTLLEAIQRQLAGQVDVQWTTDATQPETIAPECFMRPQEYAYDGLVGLTGEYFDNDSLQGQPFTLRHDHQIAFTLSDRNNRDLQQPEKLSIRWRSRLVAPATGDYLILLQQQEAESRMWIGDQEASLESTPEGGMLRCKIRLEQGQPYDLRVESRRVGRNARIRLLWQQTLPKGTPDARQLAAEADAAVVFVRDAGGAEGKDRSSLQLDPRQVDLIRQVVQANPRTVVILGCSAPLILTPLKDLCPALLCSWIAGQGESQALCDILFGAVNPSGKAPVTFFADEAQLPPLDDYDVTHGRTYQYFSGTVCYPFGYGLSYTSYRYGRPTVSETRLSSHDTLHVNLEIANTGTRDGEEIVQCYASRADWQQKGLRQKLVAFRRIALRAGENRRISFDIPASELARWDTDSETWRVEPGKYELRVGPHSAQGQSVSFEIR